MKRYSLLIVTITLILFALPVLADHFQDSNGLIIIRSDSAEFRIDASEFSAYEPTYEAPPDGAIRIWTDAYQCLQKDGTQYGDPFYSAARFAEYVGNIATYQAAYDAAHITPTPTPQPTIYAEVYLSSDTLDVSGEKIDFQAWLKDASGNILPVNQSWIIRLRDADGEEVDAIKVEFKDGVTKTFNYSAPPNANLGRIHVDESDFNPVEVPGLGIFIVKLLNPVEITLYRQL